MDARTPLPALRNKTDPSVRRIRWTSRCRSARFLSSSGVLFSSLGRLSNCARDGTKSNRALAVALAESVPCIAALSHSYKLKLVAQKSKYIEHIQIQPARRPPCDHQSCAQRRNRAWMSMCGANTTVCSVSNGRCALSGARDRNTCTPHEPTSTPGAKRIRLCAAVTSTRCSSGRITAYESIARRGGLCRTGSKGPLVSCRRLIVLSLLRARALACLPLLRFVGGRLLGLARAPPRRRGRGRGHSLQVCGRRC